MPRPKRVLSEEDKEMLRERLAKMRETLKQQREEKRALEKTDDISESRIEVRLFFKGTVQELLELF